MSGIYATTQDAMLSGSFNWTSGTFALMLVGAGYTPNYATDTTLANVPNGSQLLGTPLALAGETVTSGFCQATNPSWTALTTSGPIEGVAILHNISGTWYLVCYIDQGEGFGQTAQGQPANIIFDTRGIFQP